MVKVLHDRSRASPKPMNSLLESSPPESWPPYCKLTLLLSSVTLHSVVDSFLGPGFAPADSATDMGAPAAFPWTPWPLGSFLSRADLEANEDKLDLATLKSSTGCFPDEEVDKLALGSRDPPRPASSRVRFSLSRLNLSPADAY